MSQDNPNNRPPPLPPAIPPAYFVPPSRTRVIWTFIGGMLAVPFGLGALFAVAVAFHGGIFVSAAAIIVAIVWLVLLARTRPPLVKPFAMGMIAGVCLLILLAGGACFVYIAVNLKHMG